MERLTVVELGVAGSVAAEAAADGGDEPFGDSDWEAGDDDWVTGTGIEPTVIDLEAEGWCCPEGH